MAAGIPDVQSGRHCMELSDKTKGFYINKGWSTDVPALKTLYSPHFVIINCKLFYQHKELSSFALVRVYIPPQACVMEALKQLPDRITDVEEKEKKRSQSPCSSFLENLTEQTSPTNQDIGST